jgi:hypothetical protein
MPGKYVCPKCGRRFTEWGAEKFGFKCPTDEWSPKDHPEGVELVKVGLSEDKPTRRPTLKRGRKVAVAAPSTYTDEEGIVPDIEDLEVALGPSGEGDEEFEEAEVEEEEAFVEAGAPDEIEAVVVSDEAVAVDVEIESDEIDLGEGGEDAIEGGEDVIEEEWTE